MLCLSATTFSTRLSTLAIGVVLGGCMQDFQLNPELKLSNGADSGLSDDATTEEPAGTTETGTTEEPVDDGEGSTGEPSDPVDEPEDEPVVDDPAPEDDCTETSDLIYVLDQDSGRLALFDPTTLSLTQLGVLDCDSWSIPASMGVARDGVAYVRYADQEVFAVDLSTLRCTATSYNNSSFGSFGMGFATPTADTWRDELFVANSRQLAHLDTSTWQLTPLGSLPSQAELTGTGAGELFGVLPLESPLQVVELDQTNGAVLDTIRVGTTLDISNLDTFAFAAWDGDFYLFVRYYGMGNSTEVHKIGRDGSIVRVVSELGINVVGAGVSTCAPS